MDRLLSVVQYHNAKRFLDAQDAPSLWPKEDRALDESIAGKLATVEFEIWMERRKNPILPW
jgi:hypothetical protein